jgi:hypothetical protein
VVEAINQFQEKILFFLIFFSASTWLDIFVENNKYCSFAFGPFPFPLNRFRVQFDLHRFSRRLFRPPLPPTHRVEHTLDMQDDIRCQG